MRHGRYHRQLNRPRISVTPNKGRDTSQVKVLFDSGKVLILESVSAGAVDTLQRQFNNIKVA